MRIAVDVMGGDHGCGVIIAGVMRALEEHKQHQRAFTLSATAPTSTPRLPAGGFRDHRVRIVHASEVVEMDDRPVVALRKKKDSSIARAAELVSEGKADALISLGNTGGIFAAGTFKIGRIPGVDRGCIATVMPRHETRICLGGRRRERRVQAVSPRAIRGDGQCLFPRSRSNAKIRASAF